MTTSDQESAEDDSGQRSPWRLHCAICLFVREGIASDADTVIDGFAVCYDHMGYVAQGSRWNAIYSAARLEEGSRP